MKRFLFYVAARFVFCSRDLPDAGARTKTPRLGRNRARGLVGRFGTGEWRGPEDCGLAGFRFGEEAAKRDGGRTFSGAEIVVRRLRLRQFMIYILC